MTITECNYSLFMTYFLDLGLGLGLSQDPKPNPKSETQKPKNFGVLKIFYLY